MDNKILIISNDNSSYEVAKCLVDTNDELSIVKRFTSDTELENEVTETLYYMNNQDVIMAYRNNVLLFATTCSNITTGIAIDQVYNNDVLYMTPEEFNQISDNIYNQFDIITVWIDNKIHNTGIIDVSGILRETAYMSDRLYNNKINYLYFLNDTVENMTAVILNYINASEEEKKEILEEYS